jgi:serine/threonine protein kinase
MGLQPGEIHTEWAEEGSLKDVLREVKKGTKKLFWTPTGIAIVICDIVLGMRFVHFRSIIHRDLKPSNVFIRSHGRALIGDFGSSRFTSDYATLTEPLVTLHYTPPESFQEGAKATPKVDVWAFGLLLYEIFVGSPVFAPSLSPFALIRQLRSGSRPLIPVECGEYMGGLIRRCWSDEPSDRPTFDDICGEFQRRKFVILPGADCNKLRNTVDNVLMWERDAHISQL